MVTVAEIVEKIIKKTPFYEDGLREGIINISALARKIQPHIQEDLLKDIQVGAIVMALKRYKSKLKKKRILAQDIVKQIKDMTVRSNLIEYTYTNSTTAFERKKDLLNSIKADNEVFLIFTQGVYETTIITNSSFQSKIERLFKNEELIAKIDKVSSITIRLSEENLVVPGVYYTILKAIAWEDINIVEAISTTNEITIVFKDKDVDKAFSILKSLSK